MPQPNQASTSSITPSAVTKVSQALRLPARCAKSRAATNPTASIASSHLRAGGRLVAPGGGGARELATVVTVTVAVELPLPAGVIEEGEMVQVPGAGAPLQLSATVALKLADGVSVRS